MDKRAARGAKTARIQQRVKQAPDFGPAVAPAVPGLPEFMRAAVDWTRLHGRRMWCEIHTADVDARFPVVVSVRLEAVTRPGVTCGIDHETGVHDWVYLGGCLHPVVRRVQYQPAFTVLPAEAIPPLAIIPDSAPVPAVSGKRWPKELTGHGNGRECDWQAALTGAVGCVVVIEVPLSGFSGIRPYARSGPFTLRAWSVEDSWLRLDGGDGVHARVLCNPQKGRLFAGVDHPYFLIDGWKPDGGYSGVHVERAS